LADIVPTMSELLRQRAKASPTRPAQESAPLRRPSHLVTRDVVLAAEEALLLGKVRRIHPELIGVNADDHLHPQVVFCSPQLHSAKYFPESVQRSDRQAFLAVQVETAKRISERGANRLVLTSLKASARTLAIATADLTGDPDRALQYAQQRLDEWVGDMPPASEQERDKRDNQWWARYSQLTLKPREVMIEVDDVLVKAKVFDGDNRILCCLREGSLCSECPQLSAEEQIARTDEELQRTFTERRAGRKEFFAIIDDSERFGEIAPILASGRSTDARVAGRECELPSRQLEMATICQ
jgi:hypothetical protein